MLRSPLCHGEPAGVMKSWVDRGASPDQAAMPTGVIFFVETVVAELVDQLVAEHAAALGQGLDAKAQPRMLGLGG
ncbi:hypothetical protein [Roseateles sp.]|uniref:hypothetical protein n=1 Tax=Roseateles sp. TaxID=1971397 RepID=UPI00286CCF62|nr:hypothetical protein [Roseateles sp.]